MKRLLALALTSIALTAPLASAQAPDPLYLTPAYSQTRDPAADLAAGAARAKAEGKFVLLEVGGDWCVWCHILDKYLVDNADVRAAFAQSFVVVKVHWSREQPNEAFLSRYPKIAGYPAFIVVDAEGKLLGVQDTAALELGRSYDKLRMMAFAEAWRPR